MQPILSHRSDLDRPCPKCGSLFFEGWEIRRYINAGGATTYPYCCKRCGYKTNVCEKYSVVKQLDYIPRELKLKGKKRLCEVCGTEGAQQHHWAPYYIFGPDEWNKWPQSYLCQYCHQRWHDLVTPNMNKGG